MANPRELLQRAAENRRRRPAKFTARNTPEIPQPRAQGQEESPDLNVRLVRRPLGGHSAYSALMRSHDRVHPRIGR